MSKTRLSALALAITLLTSGCVTTGTGPGQTGGGETNKATSGAAIGAVAGGLLGAVLGGKGEGRVLGAAIGALAGGFLGQQIGQMLDEEDKKAIELQAAQALDKPDGQAGANWTNQQKGVSAEIQAGTAKNEQKEIVMVRDKNVEPPPQLDLIGKTYVAKSAVNVRAAPSTKSDVVNGLKAGEEFTAVGKVVGAPWVAVAKKGRTVGYVSQSYVAEGRAVQQVASASSLRASRGVKPGGGVDLDALGMAGVDLDKEGIVVEKVAATTTCRPLTIQLKSKDGQSETQTSQACRGTDGAWEIS
ncbi:SH3 domain-containing protein [Thiofaba sp. EF100]|uniref:SH3 domain-containing protein n=1 Tax=Thiofaba sp. EF100 TaxID=3121274 RepID=UPI0032213D9F